MLNWADVIYVMEHKHRERIIARYDCPMNIIEVLEIPGDYAYMNLLDSDAWILYYDDDVQKALLIEQHKKSKPHSTIIN